MSRKGKALACTAAVILGGAVMMVVAQDKPIPRNQRTPRNAAGAIVDERQESSIREDFVIRIKVTDHEKLQRSYIELVTKKARRMTEDELKGAVEELAQSLDQQDKEAEEELKGAIEQLKSVVDRFPSTPAAEQAERAIRAIEPMPAGDEIPIRPRR